MHYNTKQHPRKWMVNDLPNFRTKNSYFFSFGLLLITNLNSISW